MRSPKSDIDEIIADTELACKIHLTDNSKLYLLMKTVLSNKSLTNTHKEKFQTSNL